MDLKPLVIITGPTASGKTALSVELAKRIDGEIISADSMQVYKGMDIGTAKVTNEEMQGVPHHLIDILDPREDFNVYEFKTRAKAAVDDIVSRGKIPIIAGGTGFYIQALLYDIDFTDEENEDTKPELEAFKNELLALDNDALYDRLRNVDPEACEYIHKNNRKRVIRALTFFELTGTKISKHNLEQRSREAAYNFAYFVLTPEREKLYERIDQRVDRMMEDGLLEEVKALKEAGLTADYVSMKGLGYKEILSHLSGELTLEEAVNIIKRDTRHFAKRQLTWFRREREVIWLDLTKNSKEELLEDIIKTVESKKMIEC